MKTTRLVLILCLFSFLSVYPQSAVTHHSLSAADFRKVLETRSVVLIDVRTADEYSASHIPNAVNVNVNDSDFAAIVKTRAAGKSIALYCRSGRRSKQALSKLNGWAMDLYELNHGFLEWQQAGYPVTTNLPR